MGGDRLDTLVIGGSQAGVSVGHFLKQAGQNFLIVDSGREIGGTWRSRWDSLKLFTAAKHNSLPGSKFPGDPDHVPGKEEMADYLRKYAADLPVQLDAEVEQLARDGDRYVASLADRQIVADNVVVATGPTGTPRIPDVASDLDPEIVQVHSDGYKNPAQLPTGPALVVGAGNSGAEIAIELAAGRPVSLAGRDVGKFPFELGGLPYRIMNRLMTTDTKIGRNIAAKTAGSGTPLVRLKPEDVTKAGVRRAGRVTGVSGGQPKTADGSVVEPASVVWCTGYVRDYGWIKLPVFDERGEPVHHRGVVRNEPGLYFLGLPYMYTMASSLIMGVTKDAEYTAKIISSRTAG
jgi:putative flavoprotein involved in K+ transport